MSPLAAIALGAGSAAIIALSWRSLRRPGSHGFYRFFAVELLLALVVANAGVWFVAPFGARQLVSWCLLAGSIPLAIHGFHLLHSAGRPAAPAAGATELGWENTTALVRTGAYRYIRHPLYASLLLVAWGAALKRVSPPSLALAAAASAFLFATARADERECLQRFGAEYRDYIARTRMFVPFLL